MINISHLDHLVLTVANLARSIEFYTTDLRFITTTDLNEVLNHLARHHIIPESGIVQRTGAVGTIHSIYLRDPDGNLLEISRY
ncbi:hypothetical protein [Glaesserella sp.]|uniref:hypothetical protein n=1 Tax=Glaesserella sp. TaxID=2094731 RepID=UPI0035A0E6B6